MSHSCPIHVPFMSHSCPSSSSRARFAGVLEVALAERKEVNWIRSWSKAPLCLNLEWRSHYGGLREPAKQIMERKLSSSTGLQVPLVLFQKKKICGCLVLKPLYLIGFFLLTGRLNTAGAKGCVAPGQFHVWLKSRMLLKCCCPVRGVSRRLLAYRSEDNTGMLMLTPNANRVRLQNWPAKAS